MASMLGSALLQSASVRSLTMARCDPHFLCIVAVVRRLCRYRCDPVTVRLGSTAFINTWIGLLKTRANIQSILVAAQRGSPVAIYSTSGVSRWNGLSDSFVLMLSTIASARDATA